MKNKTKNCNEDIQKLAQIKWRAETEYAQKLKHMEDYGF